MIDELVKFMHAQPLFVFFIVLSLGYAIGRITLAGINLGPAGGVLLAGLVFGHFGFTMEAEIKTMGFAIFIFCVGYQAGPQFFDVLMSSGLKYLSLALVVAITGFGVTFLLAVLLGFEPGMAAGVLGGALTTTPTLAAAQDAVTSGVVTIPEGFTSQQVLTNIGAGYALTYMFGLIGLILSIRLMPKFLGIDLVAEAAKLTSGSGDDSDEITGEITRRAYRVTKSEHLSKTIGEVENDALTSLRIIGIRRNGQLIDIDCNTKFQLNDEVMVIGSVGHLLKHAAAVGEEIYDETALKLKISKVKVVVSKRAVVGKPVRELRMSKHIGALPIAAKRHRTELPCSADLVLRFGDVITFLGPEESFDVLKEEVGHVERDVADTDLLTFGLGIGLGLSLGTLAITVGGISIGLGMAGGLLIVGLLVGFLRSIWPVFGRVPAASRCVLMDLGLMMFMAGVGLNAGAGIVETIQNAGLKLVGAGIIVTVIPVLVGYLFSRKVLKLNPVEALGGIVGAMTSGAALSVVCDASKSNVPALGYTGAYAFANVILTIAGTLMMLLG